MAISLITATVTAGAVYQPNAVVAGFFDVTMTQHLTIGAPLFPLLTLNAQHLALTLRNPTPNGLNVSWDTAYKQPSPSAYLPAGLNPADVFRMLFFYQDGLMLCYHISS